MQNGRSCKDAIPGRHSASSKAVAKWLKLPLLKKYEELRPVHDNQTRDNPTNLPLILGPADMFVGIAIQAATAMPQSDSIWGGAAPSNRWAGSNDAFIDVAFLSHGAACSFLIDC